MHKLRILLLLLILTIIISSCSSKTNGEIEVINISSTPPLIIGHRGARSLAPENTLASAKKAFAVGADLWELDVAVTADKELIIMHDDTLSRTCNVEELFPERDPWYVWDFTLSEIKSLDCGSWFNTEDPFDQIKAGVVTKADQQSYIGEHAPTLREALEFTKSNNFKVNVELKKQPNTELDNIIVANTVSLIEELEMVEAEQVVISSFNHDYLIKVNSLNDNIPTQAITKKIIKNLNTYLNTLGTNTVNPKYNVWSYKRIAELEQEGIDFNVWTVNDELVMKALINSGVTGIITDFPQNLYGLLNEE
jgi:glycerophosphoryl diester phosphodiesterase